MPSKRRKRSCCTTCGRRAKGHLGLTGAHCRMDELLQQEFEELEKIDDASSIASEPEKPEWPESELGAPSVTNEGKLKRGPSVQEQLAVLTTQVGLLVTSLTKLTVGEGASTLSEKSSGPT
jgi:hypothetical protein